MNREIINIKGNNYTFPYLIEYINNDGDVYTINGSSVNWYEDERNNKCIHLLDNDIKYYRHKNDWYSYDKDSHNVSNQYIPEKIHTSKIRVYISNHCLSVYKRCVNYAISISTYINGYKIDYGSFIFNPLDLCANVNGKIKYGNIEYSEYVDFEIIDPFYIVYGDEWKGFRNNVCKEPLGINSTGSLLCVSLYSVDHYDNRYLMDSEYTGGITNFNISNDEDFLSFDLQYGTGTDIDITIKFNRVYNWLLDYFKETYNIDCARRDIRFEIILKTKDAVGAITSVNYYADEDYGCARQSIKYMQIINDTYSSFKQFFSSWNNYSEGWNFVASMIVYDNGEELFSLVSNELPITQEVFSRFVNGGSKKIIDLNEMEIVNYNVVNKIVNEVIQVERPNDSKSNIVQPVFFRVKDTELLTIHPTVTENICINLDDYKSKVKTFTLMIDNYRFKQIGSNSYGILFKIIGNKISTEKSSGIYYILDDNMELVTTGKYNCVV